METQVLAFALLAVIAVFPATVSFYVMALVLRDRRYARSQRSDWVDWELEMLTTTEDLDNGKE
jgi:hypothetical protein